MSMGTCGTITYIYVIEMQELHEGEYFKIPFSRICCVEWAVRGAAANSPFDTTKLLRYYCLLNK